MFNDFTADGKFEVKNGNGHVKDGITDGNYLDVYLLCDSIILELKLFFVGCPCNIENCQAHRCGRCDKNEYDQDSQPKDLSRILFSQGISDRLNVLVGCCGTMGISRTAVLAAVLVGTSGFAAIVRTR